MPKRTDIKKIMLIGSGPIVIGQACEFDYSGVQACKALKEEGYEVVLVNSNPATIMTDPEFADRTYIEPLTADVIAGDHPARTARRAAADPGRADGAQSGHGASRAAGVLKRYGVEMIGANAEVIRKAEDRQLFKEAMLRDRPGGSRRAVRALDGGGRGRSAMESGTYPWSSGPASPWAAPAAGSPTTRRSSRRSSQRGLFYSPMSEVLIEESVIGWKEFELEVMRDHKDNCVIVCSIENLDPMGVHTGDSITVAPAQTLTDREYQRMRDASLAVMREIGVDTGGSNVQLALHPENGRMVIIEMNPRVSRSSALASKATGFPIAKIAAKLAVGYTLDEIQQRHHPRDAGLLRADH